MERALEDIKAAQRVGDRALPFGLAATSLNGAASMPCSPSATTFSFDDVTLIPASPLSAVTVAVITVRAAERVLAAERGVQRHRVARGVRRGHQLLGLVVPPARRCATGNVTGRLNAPLPAFAVPLPSMIGPDQSTVTVAKTSPFESPPIF